MVCFLINYVTANVKILSPLLSVLNILYVPETLQRGWGAKCLLYCQKRASLTLPYDTKYGQVSGAGQHVSQSPELTD